MIRETLARCSDEVLKVGFTLAGGRDVLGWVTGVTGDHVSVLHAPGPFDLGAADGHEEPEPIPLSAIRPGSLAWYDATARRWVTHEDGHGGARGPGT